MAPSVNWGSSWVFSRARLGPRGSASAFLMADSGSLIQPPPTHPQLLFEPRTTLSEGSPPPAVETSPLPMASAQPIHSASSPAFLCQESLSPQVRRGQSPRHLPALGVSLGIGVYSWAARLDKHVASCVACLPMMGCLGKSLRLEVRAPPLDYSDPRPRAVTTTHCSSSSFP